MKKSLTVVLAVLMVLSVSINAFSASVSIGDIDSNGKITAADARRTLRVSAGLDTFNSEEMAVADIDNNGKITASDARKILRVAAGLDSFKKQEEEDELPAVIKALYDGNFLFTAVTEDEDSVYEDFYVMKDGVVNCISAFDNGSESFSSGYILYEDGSCYEFNVPEMIACAVDEEYIAQWGDVEGVRTLGAINSESTKTSVSQEYIGGQKYDIYTFSTDYGTMKFFLLGDEVCRFICYDSDYYELVNTEISEFSAENIPDPVSLDMFTVYSFEEYLEYWYGDSDAEDDYYSEEYWAHIIDWSVVEGTVITDAEDMPEEYSLLTSDKFYLYSFGRTVAPEDDLFVEDGYYYTESKQYYDNGIFKILQDESMGISFLYIPEKTSSGEYELTCYLIYEDGGICAKFDKDAFSVIIGDYELFTDFEPSQFKLIEDRAHTITVREAEFEGDKFLNISCAYDDGSYTTDFIFVNGELARLDEYDAEGTYVGTLFVYEFATGYDEQLSVEGYEVVSVEEFISSLFEI